MDSIAHALYKAITEEDAHQRKLEQLDAAGTSREPEGLAGLIPIGKRPKCPIYVGAAANRNDLHITLTKGYPLLMLQMEMINLGLTPPARLYTHGAEVLIAPGEIRLYVPTDDGKAIWLAMLTQDADGRRPGHKTGWMERLL